MIRLKGSLNFGKDGKTPWEREFFPCKIKFSKKFGVMIVFDPSTLNLLPCFLGFWLPFLTAETRLATLSLSWRTGRGPRWAQGF